MEVKIAFGVYGHKVDVGMWYFKANHGFGHTLAGHSRVNGACHTLGKQLEGDVFLIGQIEQIVYSRFGMTRVWPGATGLMSRNARWFSSSATL